MVLFMFQRRLTRFTVLKRLVPFFEDQIARRGGNSDGLNIFNYGTEISTLNENLKYGDYGSIETPKLISDYARLSHKF